MQCSVWRSYRVEQIPSVCDWQGAGWGRPRPHVLVIWCIFCQTLYICFLIFEPILLNLCMCVCADSLFPLPERNDKLSMSEMRTFEKGAQSGDVWSCEKPLCSITWYQHISFCVQIVFSYICVIWFPLQHWYDRPIMSSTPISQEVLCHHNTLSQNKS